MIRKFGESFGRRADMPPNRWILGMPSIPFWFPLDWFRFIFCWRRAATYHFFVLTLALTFKVVYLTLCRNHWTLSSHLIQLLITHAVSSNTTQCNPISSCNTNDDKKNQVMLIFSRIKPHSSYAVYVITLEHFFVMKLDWSLNFSIFNTEHWYATITFPIHYWSHSETKMSSIVNRKPVKLAT